MAPSLFILTLVALALAGLAVLMWMALLVYRILDNRRRDRREKLSDEWLTLLLPVLEGEVELSTLPKPRGREEMETVLGLLRELADRFRGQYREDLVSILDHIGAEEYGLRLLGRHRPEPKLRGCALLAWSGPSSRADERLLKMLSDSHHHVRLEAAHALARRNPEGITVETVITPLRGTPALNSDRTRDIVRLLAPGKGHELGNLLAISRNSRERVLLLDGIAKAGDLTQADVVAWQLADRDSKVRAGAVSTLEKLSDPHHIQNVAGLVSDPSNKVRLAVAKYAAAMMGELTALAMLEQLASDPDFDVQRTAVYGLADWGGPSWDNLARTAPRDSLLLSLLKEASSVKNRYLDLYELPTV
ncbi:HEAT repeat domain-containing protein [Verrucomicrobium sp. BvORR106]|uniref:HEAT repeat domain-containing protein n=1 Tax=Verrucomicrobium sp. BvORR106 TaxID=1403819 RepID=UPI000570D019|nr:HEAT repeat domain-containing protein [Verrucomicrobium sp. BvORR106]